MLLERQFDLRMRTWIARSNCRRSAATKSARSLSTWASVAAARRAGRSVRSTRLPLVTIDGPPAVSPETEKLSARFLRQFRCLPMALCRIHSVTLAMADPLDFETIAAVRDLHRSARRTRCLRPSRKFSTPSTAITEKPNARRCTNSAMAQAVGRSRTSSRHGERSARHPPGERHDRAGRRKARERYPHRAV